MQTYKSSRPPEPPQDASVAALAQWVRDFHNWTIDDSRKVEQAAQAGNDQLFGRYLNVAPDKPQDGAIVLADGTNWNPGSGKGAYRVSVSGSTVSYTFLG